MKLFPKIISDIKKLTNKKDLIRIADTALKLADAGIDLYALINHSPKVILADKIIEGAQGLVEKAEAKEAENVTA